MAEIEFRPPDAALIREIAAHARPEDVAEFWAAALVEPEEGLQLCVAHSTHAWVFMVDDEPVCMFGAAPAQVYGGDGVPWLFATMRVYRHARQFLRYSRPKLEELRAAYPHLVNYVDDRNQAAIRWLEWLGFEMGNPEPHGPLGLPFRRFEMRTGLGSMDGNNVNVLVEDQHVLR